MSSTMLFMNNPTIEKDGVFEMSAYNFWLMNKMPTLEMLLLIAGVRIWKFNVLYNL